MVWSATKKKWGGAPTHLRSSHSIRTWSPSLGATAVRKKCFKSLMRPAPRRSVTTVVSDHTDTRTQPHMQPHTCTVTATGTAQPHSRTTAQPHSRTAAQPHSHTVTQPHSHTDTHSHTCSHTHAQSQPQALHSHTRTRTHVRTCVIVCRPQRQRRCRQVCLGRCQCPPAIRRVCARQTRCLPSQCIGAPCHRLVAHSIAGRETGIIAPQQGVHSVAVTAEGSLAQELPRQPEVPALDGWRVVRIEVVCAQVPDARRTPWYGSA